MLRVPFSNVSRLRSCINISHRQYTLHATYTVTNGAQCCILKLLLWFQYAWAVFILQDMTDLLKEAHWSQVELSNQISELHYGFKRMRIIGFPGYTLVITSTMNKSLNMSMLHLGPQCLRNILAWKKKSLPLYYYNSVFTEVRLCLTAYLSSSSLFSRSANCFLFFLKWFHSTFTVYRFLSVCLLDLSFH